MTSVALALRGLRYYWRTNLAVVAGVAAAVAVLAGALLVGDSVRGSLRDLVLQRLGRTDRIVVSTGFFRTALADDVAADPEFASAYSGIAPLVVMQGIVTDQQSGQRSSRVQVYGVDDRFWRFHGLDRTGPASGEAFLSRALAADIGASAAADVLVRVERPSAIPVESLHGRKEDPGRTLRLTVREVLGPSALGDFSIRPQQGEVRAIFVPLANLQQDLGQAGLVNAMLVSDRGAATFGALPPILKRHTRLEDFGLSLRILDAQQAIALESPAGIIDGPRAQAAEHAAAPAGVLARPVFTYLANAIRHGDRQVPYSLVSAVDLGTVLPSAGRSHDTRPNRVVLNDWTARDLAAGVGDDVTLDYFIWQEPGTLQSRSTTFTVVGIVPISGAAADRDLAPVYPGITGAESLASWDPPFPIDLKKVRPADEEYWKRYRTTPKAFIAFSDGSRLWQTRFGDRTSMRIAPVGTMTLAAARERYETQLTANLDPGAMGFAEHAVRAEGLAASAGSTDFGEYFVYFSFFLVVSALVLAAMFFRLGVEQRAREVGLLRAVGFTTPQVRRLFMGEGLLLALLGSIVGVAGAVAYGAVMMEGLRTWWSGAVGTSALTLHVSAGSLTEGSLGAVAAAMACIYWTLRGLARVSERSLLAGELAADVLSTPDRLAGRRAQGAGRFRLAMWGPRTGAIAFAVLGVALIALSAEGRMDRAGAFFGAGASMLLACLCWITLKLRTPATGTRAQGRPRQPQLGIARLGLRNASDRPGRSVLAIAVIASATFILISVDAFRLGAVDPSDRRSGTGGYPLLVDLLLPVVHDPNAREGREALGLGDAGTMTIDPFRVLPGDETSCLNLYEPTSPRILGAPRRFIDAGRFSFQDAEAATEAERANPWLILNHTLPGGAIPVIADANSLTYVLHKQLGDEIVLAHGDRPIRLRLVAALSDSIFQGELLMSEANFVALFPEQQGYRFLLIDAPAFRATEIRAAIAQGAGDLGADAVPATRRLDDYHAVENTYLSTFQSLGGLGLLVGTIGLAAVLLRNVLERRRELALLRAVGYSPRNLFTIVLSENVVLLTLGLAAGALSAVVAIAPAAAQRGARLPLTAGGGLLVLAVLAAGLISSAVATRAALRGSLVGALRSE